MKRTICCLGIACLAAALALRAGAADRYVVEPGTPGVTPDGNYETWGTAATNIQHAVARAVAGETVWVTNGHYRLTNEIYLTKSLTIRGWNDDRHNVIIDGNYPVNTNRCIYVPYQNTTLASLTVTNGCVKGNQYGGGIYLNQGGNVIVSNCVVTGNRADWNGGGIYFNTYGNYLVIDTIISGNAAVTNSSAAKGGGLYVNRGVCTFTNCQIINNSASNGIPQGGGGGAGFYILSTGTGLFWNCVVSNNTAAGEGGGGLGSRSEFVNCDFIGNSAGYYGGLSGAQVVRNCTFTDNHATFRWGGGLAMRYGGSGLVSNCQFSGNSCYVSYGAGIYAAYQAIEIVDCVVVHNTNDCAGGAATGGGAGITLQDATGMVRNCTIAGNRVLGDNLAGGGGLYVFGNSAVTGINCRLEGNLALRGGGAYLTNTVLRNCLFAGNTGTNQGGALYMLGNVRAFNCTAAGNTNVLAGGAAVAGTNAGNVLVNCIAQFNPNLAAGDVSNHQNSAYVSFTNSCTLPLPALGAGNTAADPLFVDLAQGDYRLAGGSPAADAGLNQPWMIPPTDGSADLDGKPRLDRFIRLVDLGCYERVPRGTLYGVR